MSLVRLFESGVVDADADRVWSLLRDFTSGPKWAEEISACEMEDGARSDQVGAVRRMAFAFGPVARERLVALSDQDRFFDYTLLAPEELPFRDYLGRMQVLPITDSGQSLVTWTSSFTAADGDADAAAEMLGRAYRSGFAGIRKLLASG